MKENYCKRKINVDITNEEIVKTFTSTKKIIVENAIDNTVIKEITKEKDITKIINKLSIAKEVTDNTQTTEASTWYLEFYNDDDNLVTRMWLWESGYFGYSNEKEYSLSIKDIKNIIEK